MLNISLPNYKKISVAEKKFRQQNFDIFKKNGFPIRKDENWKFTNIKEKIENSFSNLNFLHKKNKNIREKSLKEFKHSSIFLQDGDLTKINIQIADKKKIKIKNLKFSDIKKQRSLNTLGILNNAFFSGGFVISIKQNADLKYPLIFYNNFSKKLNNCGLNKKYIFNFLKNSSANIVFVNNDFSEGNYFLNQNSNYNLDTNAKINFYNIYLRNNSINYSSVTANINQDASLKFINILSNTLFLKKDFFTNLNEKNSNCEIYSNAILKQNEHFELQTVMSHLAPHCTSYQKVKKVLEDEAKGIYQGKIYVKKNAQKTDAYQLSKAILLNNETEFDAKPELEIYADDVKCSHGSSSGNLDENAIFYLMSRGLDRKQATNLLIEGFFRDIAETINHTEIKKYLIKIIEKKANEIR